MFASPYTGRPYSADTIRTRYLRPAALQVGIKGFGWHSIRHSYKSWMAAAKINPAHTRDLMRHSDIATTMDVYGHTLTPELRESSSGGANTVMQQAFQVKQGQRAFNSGGLASMGYGLCGAIGAAFAANGRRTILVEGDGGFTQNLQELGTVSANHLNLKIFLFDNNGYASIRMTQKNYFGGHYVGCDRETGLGIPNWEHLFAAYGIPVMPIGVGYQEDESFLRLFESTGPAAFLVKIDPNQTYFPKISSRVGPDGAMESNPLHLMSPELPAEVSAKVFRYLHTF